MQELLKDCKKPKKKEGDDDSSDDSLDGWDIRP